ncbi:MAG: ABC-F family ATP-binding cassette domain-containing protein, partial [Candidatus Cloacimonetes bacterium]|nr:ABC-F family ATP-binding cassette domain-containing protein [Candidatus Cloacimonadota bacterium]
VKNISGGEKVRLELSIMMNQDINLLLLDEPSNHLDTDSREMFEQALQKFIGTVVFISHDRYLINKIAKRIVELRDKKFVNYLGNYDYYKQKKVKENLVTIKEIPEIKPQKVRYERDKRIQKEKKKVERRILEIEEEMKKIENQISEKDKEMEKWATDYKKLYDLYKEKCGLQKKLDLLFEEWTQIKLQI